MQAGVDVKNDRLCVLMWSVKHGPHPMPMSRLGVTAMKHTAQFEFCASLNDHPDRVAI
jgi:hypothetical protein